MECLGITREPLEAWMATTGCRPHLHTAPVQPRLRTRDDSVRFVAGDATLPPVRRRYDLVLCNGLVGGGFLCEDSDYRRLLAALRRVLAPGGLVAAAARFHQGRRPHLERFAVLARRRGWTVTGAAHALALSPEP